MFTLLILTATLAAEPAPSPGDASAREGKHLREIRQVTFGFSKAGEGYFRPDGKAIIFQAARPGEEDYQVYTLDLELGAKPKMVSTGKGKCTCAYYHPDGRSILFASTHLDPALSAGVKPDRAKVKAPAYSRTARYRWDFDPAMDIFKADLDGIEPGPADRHPRLRRRGELLRRWQADHLHLVPRRQRRDLHHGR